MAVTSWNPCAIGNMLVWLVVIVLIFLCVFDCFSHVAVVWAVTVVVQFCVADWAVGWFFVWWYWFCHKKGEQPLTQVAQSWTLERLSRVAPSFIPYVKVAGHYAGRDAERYTP